MIDATSIANAAVTLKGNDWGDVPVWTLVSAERHPPDEEGAEGDPVWVMDVHAIDEKDARAKALAATTVPPEPTPVPFEDKLTAALEAMPPDRVVSASELLAIIKGD